MTLHRHNNSVIEAKNRQYTLVLAGMWHVARSGQKVELSLMSKEATRGIYVSNGGKDMRSSSTFRTFTDQGSWEGVSLVTLNLMSSSCVKYRAYALAIIMFYHQVSFRIGYF